MMRIITGKAKGVRLATLEGDHTRPTTERVKEAVFSMLQFDIEGRKVLDMFAGSGQMGLEALSRGAVSAVFIDNTKAACDVVRKNIERTHMEAESQIYCGDFETILQQLSLGKNAKKQFDLVFMDPPYDSDLLKKSIYCLKKYNLIKPSSLLVCECGKENETLFDTNAKENVFKDYLLLKKVRYGVTWIAVLMPKPESIE